MPRSVSSYGSPPPSYRTPAPSTAYGTLGSAPQRPSEHSRQTYARSDNAPTATETTSLWNGAAYPRRSSRWTSLTLGGIVVLLLTVVLAQNAGLWSTLVDDVSPSEKAAIRRNWRLEEKVWAAEKKQWGLEKARHQDEVAMWGREREEHWEERDAFERDRAGWVRQRQEERDAFEREKAGWARQRQEEQDAFEKEKEERERQRQEEGADWGRQRQEERDAFEREKEEWARQRLEEERHNKEIEWRRRGAYWTEPWATSWQCSGYGTRPYSAHLIDLPGDVNWLEACMNMPIKINGQWIDKPNKCQRDNHNTWGTWSINFGESQCATYWDTMYNRGCSAGQTGMRRYEARLMNLRHGDDWDLMCRTTPATISGVHFDSPLVCEDKNGRTGVWDVPDGLC